MLVFEGSNLNMPHLANSHMLSTNLTLKTFINEEHGQIKNGYSID